MIKNILIAGMVAMCGLPASFTAQAQVCEKDLDGYLFTYFKGNHMNDEQICFALSKDGFNFKALNGNEPVIDSKKISSTGGVRDPHILRGEDGKTFYMVVTDMVSGNGWDSNRAMVLMKSDDIRPRSREIYGVLVDEAWRRP